jgi:uncharacterized protein
MFDLDFLFNGPKDAPLTIALAHGAGAMMDSAFMNIFSEGLAERGHRIARFEFPYMIERRKTGRKRPPDRAPILAETWRSVINQLGPSGLVIGGKSMGGRIASTIADEEGVRALICLGYPFHAPGKPDRLRISHLEGLSIPSLFVQGRRDSMGTYEEVSTYPLSSSIQFHWAEDGDHGLRPRKKSGRTEQQNVAEAICACADFISSL